MAIKSLVLNLPLNGPILIIVMDHEQGSVQLEQGQCARCGDEWDARAMTSN